MRTYTLADDVRTLLPDCTVAPGALRARVLGEDLTAKTPRDMVRVASGHLYHRLHAGLAAREPELRVRTLRDPEADAALAAQVPHGTCVLTARWLGRTEDGRARVALDGLRYVVEPDELVDGVPPAGAREVRVRLAAARPALSPGFFLVDGSAGPPRGHRALLRVYVHLRDVQEAPAAWGAALRTLEASGSRYRAKVSSSPDHYPRRDALVVYLPAASAGLVPLVADAVRRAADPQDDTSVFCRRVAPGVAVAWEPEDPRVGHRGRSFGEHRAHALAYGLVRHALADRGDPATAVVEAMLTGGIDPARPWRNLDSPALVPLG